MNLRPSGPKADPEPSETAEKHGVFSIVPSLYRHSRPFTAFRKSAGNCGTLARTTVHRRYIPRYSRSAPLGRFRSLVQSRSMDGPFIRPLHPVASFRLSPSPPPVARATRAGPSGVDPLRRSAAPSRSSPGQNSPPAALSPRWRLEEIPRPVLRLDCRAFVSVDPGGRFESCVGG